MKQIQEHEKEQHTIATEFKCEDCERIFKSEKKLGDHKSFQCLKWMIVTKFTSIKAFQNETRLSSLVLDFSLTKQNV